MLIDGLESWTGCVRPETQARVKSFALHCVPKFMLGELWPANSHHVIPCDQRQIDTAQQDLVAELKEHKFKTAALQESGVDCVFLHFRGIIICYVLNLTFLKKLQSMTSYHDRCSMRGNFACSKSNVNAALGQRQMRKLFDQNRKITLNYIQLFLTFLLTIYVPKSHCIITIA